MRACPEQNWLETALGDGGSSADARRAHAHLTGCESCRERRASLDPASIFRYLPRRTLASAQWEVVWASVRKEIAEDAQPEAAHDLAWTRWLAPMALAAALILTAGLSFWRGAPMTPGVVSRVLPADEADEARPVRDQAEDADDGRFAYLSNPHAVIAHVFVAGDDGAAPIPLTMVIDDRLADLF